MAKCIQKYKPGTREFKNNNKENSIKMLCILHKRI